jgi:Flp pilus assembly protein TadG
MGMWSTALERRRRGRGRPRQRGQSLVEFALVFPLFILLLAGMIDFGLGLYSYMTINNATRDSARLGATMCTANPCAAAVSARAVNTSSGLAIDAPQIRCTTPPTPPDNDPENDAAVNCASGTVKPGDSVIVTIHYKYKMIWPLGFGTVIDMESHTTMLAD